MDNKNILIIGGAGFIGSHLVDRCLNEGLNVWVYDNFSTGKKTFLGKLGADKIIKGDILDANFLCDAINDCKPEIIFHLAAVHHIPTCEKEPRHALKVNIEGTANVLEFCNEKVKKFVFASTGALYDPSNIGSLSEESPLKPSDIYSISKMTCEYLMEYYSKKKNIKIMSARLFNTVGRRETNRHLIPDILDQLVEGRNEIRLGNLTPLRDYIHVEDVAEALFEIAKLETTNDFEIFNVGTGVEHSVVDLVNLFSEVIGKEIKIVSDEKLKRKIDRPTQKADSSKLQRMTIWKPRRSLKQALKEVWEESHERVLKD